MELNEAITKVLLEQFKKYMDKEAVFLVEKAGYRIVKREGGYEIRNEATGRWVDLCRTWRYGYDYEVRTVGKTAYLKANNLLKFDFANYLNTAINYAWREVQYKDWYGTPTQKKLQKLRDAKWRVSYRKQDIEKTKQDIANFTNKLEREIRSKVNAENELANVRKELGLK